MRSNDSGDTVASVALPLTANRGATVQGIYYCPQCQKETESKLHRCGQPTQHLRGWRWLNNDLVNFVSSIVGSLMAGFLGWLVF